MTTLDEVMDIYKAGLAYARMELEASRRESASRTDLVAARGAGECRHEASSLRQRFFDLVRRHEAIYPDWSSDGEATRTARPFQSTQM